MCSSYCDLETDLFVSDRLFMSVACQVFCYNLGGDYILVKEQAKCSLKVPSPVSLQTWKRARSCFLHVLHPVFSQCEAHSPQDIRLDSFSGQQPPPCFLFG